MTSAPARRTVAGCELDLASGRLLRDGREVPLPKLAYRLIALLATRPGVLLGRDEVAAHLWPDTHVTANSLDQVVRRARQALGDAAITTVPGRGLRLDAPVAVLGHEPGRAIVGRAVELAALEAATRDHRLVTLHGPGGIGKTTLVQAWQAEARSQRVAFVDLEPDRSAEDVSAAVALAAGANPGEESLPALALARAGELALVLDNAESVVEVLRRLLPAWLAAAPRLRVVVTSRVLLGLRVEHVLRVGPLAPDHARLLFATRAGAAPDDPLTAEVVRALDGVPLAIELAARRARWLPLGHLLELLRRHELPLADPSPDRPERHHTLDAAHAACWDGLDADQRRAVAALTPFRAAIAADAARAVIGPAALDRLQELADRSWLQRAVGPGAGELRLLAATRQFVRDHADAPHLRDAEVAHGRWFARPASPTEASDVARGALADRIAAAEAAIARGDADVAAGAALAAWPALRRQGPLDAAVRVLEGALALDAGARAGELHHALGVALTALRPADAVRHLEHAASLGPDVAVRLDLASARLATGDTARAEHELAEGAEAARASGSSHHEALALTRLGASLGRRGERERAQALHAAALAVSHAAGDAAGVATAATNLAIELEAAGRSDEAEARYRQALEIRVTSGNLRGEVSARGNLAVLLARSGRTDEALDEQRRATDLARLAGDGRALATQLANLGALHVVRDEPEAAERALTEALEAARSAADRTREAHASLALGRLRRSRGALVAASDALARALALLEGSAERRLLATALVEQAALCRARGDAAGADAALDRAAALGDWMDASARAAFDAARAAPQQGPEGP